MTYFNYHAKAKSLIKLGHCVRAELVDNYKNIGPSLILYFDNHIPMPIRPQRFMEYFKLLEKQNILVNPLCTPFS